MVRRWSFLAKRRLSVWVFAASLVVIFGVSVPLGQVREQRRVEIGEDCNVPNMTNFTLRLPAPVVPALELCVNYSSSESICGGQNGIALSEDVVELDYGTAGLGMIRKIISYSGNTLGCVLIDLCEVARWHRGARYSGICVVKELRVQVGAYANTTAVVTLRGARVVWNRAVYTAMPASPLRTFPLSFVCPKRHPCIANVVAGKSCVGRYVFEHQEMHLKFHYRLEPIYTRYTCAPSLLDNHGIPWGDEPVRVITVVRRIRDPVLGLVQAEDPTCKLQVFPKRK